MNFKTDRVKIIILFVLGCLSHSLFAQVEFQETSLKLAQTQIANAQTPYLIYFSGVWCPSCQLMEETTFTDQKLGDQIQKNFLAYKVDVDSKEGKKWMEEYAVTCLPTTIFYSANDQLLERIEKPITSTEFLAMTSNDGFKSSSLIAQNFDKENSSTNLNTKPKNTKSSDIALFPNEEKNDNAKGNNSSVNTLATNRLNDGEKSTHSSTLSNINASNSSYEKKSPTSNAKNLINPNLADQNGTNHALNNQNSKEKLSANNGVNSSNSSTPFNTKENNSVNGNESIASSTKGSSGATLAPSNSANYTNITNKTSELPANINEYNAQAATNHHGTSKAIANYNMLIEELDTEINELKTLQQSTNSTDNLAAKNQVFKGVNSNGATDLNSSSSKTFLTPSTDNLMAQISACKALLSDVESLQKLIGILENYQRLLIEMKAAQIELAQQAIPSERSTINTSKDASNKKISTNTKADLFSRNQSIINHLKLVPPVKTGNQYIVQLGKYHNVRNAERLVQIIQDKYDYPIKVLIENTENIPLQTVYLGEFKTQKEAITANKNLRWIKRKGIVKKF